MALSYKARRRWSLVILLVWVPLYVVACVTVMGWLGRPSFLVELAVYVVLGLIWALPFRAIFRGIGRADPEAPGATGAGNDSDIRDSDSRGGGA